MERALAAFIMIVINSAVVAFMVNDNLKTRKVVWFDIFIVLMNIYATITIILHAFVNDATRTILEHIK